MESLFLSPEQFRTGTQSLSAGGLTGALLQSLLKSLDIRPGMLCEATVLEQQGRTCTLQIASQTITAELPTEDLLPEKITLRMLSARGGSEPVISMQIAGKEALNQGSYIIDANQGKLAETVRSFMPSLTENQSELLFKLLPYFKGDLHENLASFIYLLGMDSDKLQAHILESGGDKAAPRELVAALSAAKEALSSCPASVMTGEEKKILDNIIKIIDTMQKKIAGAKNMHQFTDNESAPLAQSMKDLVSGHDSQVIKPDGAARSIVQTPQEKSQPYVPASDSSRERADRTVSSADDRTGSARKASHSSHADVKSIDETIRHGEKPDYRTVLSGHDGRETGAIADRRAVLEYLSGEATIDRLMDRTLKPASAEWNTTYAWKALEDSQVLKGIHVEERKQGTGGKSQQEYQVSFDLSLPSVGDMTCVVYWMEHSIGCRIVCDSSYSQSLFELHRSQLEERFRERGVSCMHIKVEQGG